MVPTTSSVSYVSPQVLGITISGVPTAGEVLVSTGVNSAGWQAGIPATFLQLVGISATAPAIGDVLVATSSTTADWQVPAFAPVTSVFGRVGAVSSVSGDYTVSQITGAAPLASPTFTGTATIAAMSITGTLKDGSAAVGVSGQVLSSTGTGTLWVNSVTSVGLLGTSGQITVTGSSPITTTGSFTLSIPAALTLGTPSSVAGSLILAQTTAYATTIIGAATANWTLTLPPTAGTVNYVLTTNGSGVCAWAAQTGGSGMTWPLTAGIAVYAGASAWGTSLTAPTSAIVGISDTQTLTNKTIDGVTPTTMSYLDATSSIQTQLNALAPTASPTFTGTATFTNVSISGTTSFASNAISLSAVAGAAPLANPTFTGTVNAAAIIASGTVTAAEVNAPVAVNTQTSSYVAVLSDANQLVVMNDASANTFTVPENSSVAFSVGTTLTVVQLGAGQVTLTAGAGTTFHNPSSATTRAQYSTVSMVQVSANVWILGGDLS
jgi:hypothetical protein